MKPERLDNLGRAFQRILEQPEDRESILQEECGTDERMRADLDLLLAADADASGFLEGLATPADSEASTQYVGQQLGSYRVHELIGRGGMGTVHRATRVGPEFEQEVAIKFMSPAAYSVDLVERFHRERQILARLSHPHIARLFDGGTTEDGLPYLVMELVHGVPITAYCEQAQLGIDEQLRLFCKVADAVEAAHRSLVIHRDLKPSNILIDEHGEPKLLDFGLAKNLHEDELTRPRLPWFALMTPRYASPEQLRGEPLTVATDVYSLGLILYELLTGDLPPRSVPVAQGDEPELQVRPPSAVANAATRAVPSDGDNVAPGKDTAPRKDTAPAKGQRREAVHRDLDTIVLKALAGDTEQRYGSVAELHGDLRRYLERRPILARRPTLAYRTARFLARNRLGASIAAALLVLACTLAFMLWSQVGETRDQRDRAQETLQFVIKVFEASSPDQAPGELPNARQILQNGARRIDLLYSGRPEVQGDLLDVLGSIHARFGLSDSAKELLRKGQRVRTEHQLPPEEHLDGLLSLVDVHSQLDEYDEAREVLDQAHQLLAQHGAKRPEQLVRASALEAILLKVAAKADEHAIAARRAMELSRQHLGPTDDHTINLLELLAGAELALGNRSEARAVLAEATTLALARDTPYSGLHGLLFRRSQLARAAGHFDEAVALSRRSLSEAQPYFEPKHPYLGRLGDHLADCLVSAGEHEEAIAMYREGVPDDSTEPTRSHGAVFTDLGSALSAIGRNEEARESFQRAIEIFLVHLGPRHPNTLGARFGLANVLHRTGELDAARDVYEQCLRDIDVLDGRVPAGYPRIGYAWLLLEMGKQQRGLDMAKDGRERIRQTHPPQHWRVHWADAAHGAALYVLGQQDDGKAMVRVALESLSGTLGADDRRVRGTATRLQRIGLQIPQSTEIVPDTVDSATAASSPPS